MTPEGKVKLRVKLLLTSINAYYFLPATHGYGSSGIPDIVACVNGRFIGIECKAGKGKTTALQEKNLNAISQAGGLSIVVNEKNVDDLLSLLGVQNV